MATNPPHQLERIQYWQGQMLRAGDFRVQQATEEQLRWWHNRGLHKSYGVRFGLIVTPVTNAPLPTLQVACGLAYDCFGHELILPQRREVIIPTALAEDNRARILLIRYHANGNASSCCHGPVEPCWPASGSHSPGNIDLAWKVEDQVQTADGVPLARVKFSVGARTLDPFQPPIARPLARARLASGDTIPGNTPWEVWYEGFTDNQGNVRPEAIGMQTRVDTSAAGFTSVPCYFAQLMGPLWDRGAGVYIPAFFPSIADATTNGFTFRLLMRGIAKQQVEADTQVPENEIAFRRTRNESSAGRRLGTAAPQRVQQVIRVVGDSNLRPGDQLLITTADAVSEETGPTLALIAGVDPKKNLVLLDFGATGSLPQLANKFSAVTVFNPDFGAFFTAFARRQKLHVCWLGCRGYMETPTECPGLIPVPQPCDQIQI
jgi:hypothetical protein